MHKVSPTNSPLRLSVYNDRTSIYKNSQFDFILDQNASQRKLYDRAAIGELVHAVVDVTKAYL